MPAPPIPPPALVSPPASLTQQGPQTENDRDAMAAYQLLSSGQHAEASKIAAQIAKRDPKNEHLRDLRAQIQKVADTEKERAAAVAAAAAIPPPVAPAVAAPPPTAPPPPAADPTTKPDLTVLPGGGFAAASEPAAPPLIGEVERPGVEASIQEYAKALTAKNLPAVSRVRVYTPAEAKSWMNIFKQFAEYRLIVKVLENPSVQGDRATIPVEETVFQTAKKGDIQVRLSPRTIVYKLQKIDGKWMILSPQ